MFSEQYRILIKVLR